MQGISYFQACLKAFLEANRRVINEASVKPIKTAAIKKYSKSSLSTSKVRDGVTCVKKRSANGNQKSQKLFIFFYNLCSKKTWEKTN